MIDPNDLKFRDVKFRRYFATFEAVHPLHGGIGHDHDRGLWLALINDRLELRGKHGKDALSGTRGIHRDPDGRKRFRSQTRQVKAESAIAPVGSSPGVVGIGTTLNETAQRGPVVRNYSIATVDAAAKPIWHHKSVIALFQITLQLLTDLLALTALAFRQRRATAAEILVLRRQIALYKERGIKPRRIDAVTRISLALLSRFFNWRDALFVVHPRDSNPLAPSGMEIVLAVEIPTRPAADFA